MKNIVNVDIIKIKGEKRYALTDQVIREYLLTICLNNQEITTLLCTPENLEELSIGFLLSEGFLDSYTEVTNSNLDKNRGFIKIAAKIDGKTLEERLKVRRGRAYDFVKEASIYPSLDSVSSKNTGETIAIRPLNVISLMRDFTNKSILFNDTGGVHSCALCHKDKILVHRDDIGRHNALDKILGWGHIAGNDFSDKMILTTGRISSETLVKIARSGIPVIISKSAPTSLAVDLAKKWGITLVGFARRDKMNIYTNFPSIDF